MTALQHTFEFTTIATQVELNQKLFYCWIPELENHAGMGVKTSFFDGIPTIFAYTYGKSLLLAHHISSSKEGCRVFHHPACCSGTP